MTAITASGLVKPFGSTRALDELDMMVNTGEVHGFLGPNGSGKTTTIRILLGLLRADSGSATVLGKEAWRNSVELHRRLATGRRSPSSRLSPPTSSCSYSTSLRLGLTRSWKPSFQDYVRELKRAGRTVLESSHILAEVEALCDRLNIIRLGRTVESGTLADLRHLTRTSVTVETVRPISGLERFARVHDLQVTNTHAAFDVDTNELGKVMQHIVPCDIRTLSNSPPTLEELFLRHNGDELEVEQANHEKSPLS